MPEFKFSCFYKRHTSYNPSTEETATKDQFHLIVFSKVNKSARDSGRNLVVMVELFATAPGRATELDTRCL